MHNLSDGPSAVALSNIEFPLRQPGNRSLQLIWPIGIARNDSFSIAQLFIHNSLLFALWLAG
jgi:hypothetical protein